MDFFQLIPKIDNYLTVMANDDYRTQHFFFSNHQAHLSARKADQILLLNLKTFFPCVVFCF